MAFFPQLSGEFSPLFRMLDDYDIHRSTRPKSRTPPPRSFVPKFDVRELKDGYQLDGELPGASPQNIDVEFTDPQELVISGHVEREYNHTSPDESDRTETTSNHKARQPTVEDEDEEGCKTAAAPTPTEMPPKKIRKSNPSPKHKYWASERVVGEFQRTFTFPARVDQDGVKASFKDGILSVIVPKASVPKTKKITVD